jgi:hypothetical protein
VSQFQFMTQLVGLAVSYGYAISAVYAAENAKVMYPGLQRHEPSAMHAPLPLHSGSTMSRSAQSAMLATQFRLFGHLMGKSLYVVVLFQTYWKRFPFESGKYFHVSQRPSLSVEPTHWGSRRRWPSGPRTAKLHTWTSRPQGDEFGSVPLYWMSLLPFWGEYW